MPWSAIGNPTSALGPSGLAPIGIHHFLLGNLITGCLCYSVHACRLAEFDTGSVWRGVVAVTRSPCVVRRVQLLSGRQQWRCRRQQPGVDDLGARSLVPVFVCLNAGKSTIVPDQVCVFTGWPLFWEPGSARELTKCHGKVSEMSGKILSEKTVRCLLQVWGYVSVCYALSAFYCRFERMFLFVKSFLNILR